MTTTNARYDIVPTSLAVMAMRDNGYKNAAYALAELMDNSIQAGATSVELLCGDREFQNEQRTRKRVETIAVLDNGAGMDAETLQIALQFGNGTRLESSKHKNGMGRFGMGLPSASISQCKRVEVWSWQNGPKSAQYTHIDLDEIAAGELNAVPAPKPKPIPTMWMQAAHQDAFGKSGTLVVWTKIDRMLWRMSSAVISNSEALIGRMYRHWLNDGRVKILLKSFMTDNPKIPTSKTDAKPNDPLYLMADTSCPAPFDKTAMFRPFPSKDQSVIKHTIRFKGEIHEVVLRFTIATEDARAGTNAGSKQHGQHAAKNVGVSVVRAGRELELDPSWAQPSEPRERWWGVEISFGPGLDELFGVTNNKQSARNLAEAAKLDVESLVKNNGGSISAVRRALAEEEDPLEPLIEVVWRMKDNIKQMRDLIGTQKSRTDRKNNARHDDPQKLATDAVRDRQKAGHKGQSDEDEAKPPAERKAELADELELSGYSPESAHEVAALTIDNGMKYVMETRALEGGAFFSVQPRGGVLLVTLNRDHPAFDLLHGAQNPEDLPSDVETLKAKLLAAQSGLEMLLFAYARYEDEQKTTELRRAAQRVRFDWGQMAESFMETKG